MIILSVSDKVQITNRGLLYVFLKTKTAYNSCSKLPCYSIEVKFVEQYEMVIPAVNRIPMIKGCPRCIKLALI